MAQVEAQIDIHWDFEMPVPFGRRMARSIGGRDWLDILIPTSGSFLASSEVQRTDCGRGWGRTRLGGCGADPVEGGGSGGSPTVPERTWENESLGVRDVSFTTGVVDKA